ncbi:MAG: hypothetical protein AAFQ63_08750 [Cyanobacteria bacterium J06621_11]
MISNESTVEHVLGESVSEEKISDEKISDEKAVNNDWEPANLPGTVLAADQSEIAKTTTNAPKAQSKTEKSTAEDNSRGFSSTREGELLALIHDLNECNDVLLARVSQLETGLEDSHKILQEEREQAKAAQHKIMDQANAQQASAQQLSQNAQQQVAKLVAQIETAEQGLQRQQLVNETLLAELENARERVSQLEHECALNTQQQAEEAQARVAAESTIRDLRSRLQRQQRYTLQFKAALEKSLTVTASAAHNPISPPIGPYDRSQSSRIHTGLQPISSAATARSAGSQRQTVNNISAGDSASVSGGVTMPKAQRIVPWASQSIAPFEGIDPHLESLIRGASQPTPETKPAAADNQISLNSDSPNSDLEAESQLWQDLERVIENSETEKNEVENSEPKNSEAEKNNRRTAEENLAEKTLADTNTITVKAVVDTLADPDRKETAETTNNISDQKVETLSKTSRELETLTQSEKNLEQTTEQISKSTPKQTAEEAPKFNWRQSGADTPTATESPAEIEPQSPTPTPVAASLETDPQANTPSETEPAPVTNNEVDTDSSRSNIPSIVIDPYTVPEGQTPATEVAFTEPSPWRTAEKAPVEKPAKELVQTQGNDPSDSDLSDSNSIVEANNSTAAEDKTNEQSNRFLSFLESDQSGVSPVVNPLRSQKKINSMASVQLPTFEKAKVSSFKR